MGGDWEVPWQWAPELEGRGFPFWGCLPRQPGGENEAERGIKEKIQEFGGGRQELENRVKAAWKIAGCLIA